MSRARWAARELGPPLLGGAAAAALWAAAAALTDTDAIPSPASVWSAFRSGLSDGSFAEATLKTLIRLGFSFTVAVAAGIVTGLLLALNELLRRAIRPLVVGLQIAPFVAWVPLAVVWFGVTERAVVFVTIVGAFPSMALATLQAIRQVPPPLERAGRTLGASGMTLYRRVIVPAAMPGVMAGLQQAWGFAWKALMAGELIVTAAGATGLGHLLAREGDDVAALLAVLAVIVIVGVAIEYLVFGTIDRRIRAKRGLIAAG